MNQEIKNLLSVWVGAFPESGHPLDNERLYDLVFSYTKNHVIGGNEDIYQEIKEQKKWDDEYSQKFSEEFSSIISHIVDFVDYLKEKHAIDFSIES